MKKLIYVFWFIVFHATAQNYHDDIVAVNKNILGRTTYSFQLNYKLYIDGNMSSSAQQSKAIVVRQGPNMYVKQNSDVEVVETKSFQFLFDHAHKFFSTREKKSDEDYTLQDRQTLANLADTYVDSMASVFKTVKVIYNDEKTVKYECVFKPNPKASLMWVEIDKQLKLYRSITTQYKEKTKLNERDDKEHLITVKVEYSGFSSNPAVSPAMFNALTYVAMHNKKITGPAKKYSQYKYLNHAQ